MAFWDRFRGISSYDPAQRVLPEPFEPYVSTAGIPVMDPGTPLEFWRNGERSQVEHFWRTQPNVRKVVDFIARNAAIPMHAYERVSDTDRQRLSGEPLSDVLSSPRKGVGPFRFWHSVISDGLLYDRWCILKDYSSGSLELVQVPSWRLRIEVDALRRVTGLRYWAGDDGRLTGDDAWIGIDLDEAIFDHGYAPRRAGLSPIETLRDILDESAEAVAYRRSVWKNGARVPGYISRPKEAPWPSDAARDRFVAGMQAYTRDGDMAGRLPILEDGMKIEDRETFSPQDANDLEGRRLTAIECAAAWHIAPELVGAQQGNYSNVKEYRQMLYRDSLGPYIWPIEQALNAQLVPELARGRNVYVEANIESKLRGSFEEQAQIMQSAVGAPWTTRNEARARMNMPPIDGGDDIVTPLNVLTGGQASPRDGVTAGGGGAAAVPVEVEPTSPTVGGFTPAEIVALVGAAATLIRSGFAPEASLVAVGLDPVEHLGLLPVTVQRPQAVDNPDEEVEDALKTATAIRAKATSRALAGVKAAPSDPQVAKARQVLAKFFGRQEAVVLSRIGSGSGWWDEKRWDDELTSDLLPVAHSIAATLGKAEAARLGFDDGYDPDQTVEFLKAVAGRYAQTVNQTTKAQLDQALASDEPNPAHVFDVAKDSRAAGVGAMVATFAAGFAAVEAAKQIARGNNVDPVKTWITGANPRPEHAAMDGETVPIDEPFSDGNDWPGGLPGCNCSVSISIP